MGGLVLEHVFPFSTCLHSGDAYFSSEHLIRVLFFCTLLRLSIWLNQDSRVL